MADTSQVMVMKMHSYMTVNGQLPFTRRRCGHLLDEMHAHVSTHLKGWENAIVDASICRAELEAAEGSESGAGTPPVPEGATKTSYVDVKTANDLRRRLNAMADPSDGTNSEVSSNASDASVNTTIVFNEGGDSSTDRHSRHPLVHHPDPELAKLAEDYSDLQSELTSSGPEYVTWPSNLSWSNFATYQLIPTLVYELEYPRTERCVIWLL